MCLHIGSLLRLPGKSPASLDSLRNLQAAFHTDYCDEEHSKVIMSVSRRMHTLVDLCICSNTYHLVNNKLEHYIAETFHLLDLLTTIYISTHFEQVKCLCFVV